MSTAPRALGFAVGDDSLTAIFHPAAEAAAWAVLVVVGGPQYRAGSHRQFVQLARALAGAGHAVMRFDVRGMGDSEGAMRPFDDVTPDIAAAIDTLYSVAPGLRGVVLWGLCDGASAALLYCEHTKDTRVAGLALVNPWVRSGVTHARTTVKHYYWNRLRSPELWSKVVRGGVGLGRLKEFVANLRTASARAPAGGDDTRDFVERMHHGWSVFRGPILLALSGNDYTAKEFLELTAAQEQWKRLTARPNVTQLHLPDADHTFSAAAQRTQLEASTVQWLDKALHAHA